MRVAIIAESFLPNINGVTNSVLRVLEHLRREGHEALVIAPGARDWQEEAEFYCDYRIERVPTVMVPLIDSLPIGVPNRRVASALTQFKPDVVHLASPFVLGGAGALTAKALGIPAVAIYQTDVAGFAKNYKLAGLSTAAWLWTRVIHNSCARTLAPSSPTIEDLQDHKIRDVYRWGRGVDAVRFTPTKRSEELRKQWSPEGKPIVGYVGRLAAEKSVERLAALNGRDGIQVVIVGNGPELQKLQKQMPNAVFTGQLTGDKLAAAFASLDVFVHTGDFETFCQAVQEAHASGVPAIAPNAGGPRDLITNDVNGYLLEPKTFTRDLSEAVDKLLLVDDELARKQLRNRCRDTVTERTWEALCADLVRHYEEVSGVSAAETSSKVAADAIDASRAGAATRQKSVA
ncbi:MULTISPECIES: glycosyltransferase family 1 protein [Corynebacterium]|uniref:glycosyltransferase family 4 protein n=1 Tax=Corynebacterium TaxID=1716 RepID=UPI0008A3D5FB|nr:MULTISPECIES: glycosyltransferase family 1 protein [Corynebacterium]MDK8728194.1 glycosyltransferase family 1 protein [Corynebacterium amycolatum]OFL10705.1 alpha-mannosyltransferase [Corynebacterium sp. HMSC063F04]OHR38310.1 alpha-mannosyltransferase [Corynebacterium sp. HMSC075F02]